MLPVTWRPWFQPAGGSGPRFLLLAKWVWPKTTAFLAGDTGFKDAVLVTGSEQSTVPI